VRPVGKGTSPIQGDFDKYEDAKVDLVSCLGSYCSYCERKISTNLAVEHIEPKDGAFGQPHLEKRWSNFLLACVNCNSSKGSKQVIINNLFFPDRDNTLFVFEYLADGNISPSASIINDILNKDKANETLKLFGLDKTIRRTLDKNGKQIALDKMSQRMEIWGIATLSLRKYERNQTNQDVKDLIVENMIANGFFSVWMTVYKDYPEMKNLFIDAMNGTRNSGCFDNQGDTISPHPNVDGLDGGGKV